MIQKSIASISLGILLLSAATGWSQTAPEPDKKNDHSKTPVWIEMMNDPQVNYFEAVRAFEKYWEKRAVPAEEGEWEKSGLTNNKGRKSLFARIFPTEEKREAESTQYAVAYRQFKMWRESVQAYVKPDGSLLTMDERLELWKKLRQ